MRQWARDGLTLAQRTEAPTWILTAAIYGGWLALTWYWHSLPVWIVAPAGAWLCAWHMSLQHELLHGHPTHNPAVNAALGWPPLNLWLPYAIYRDSHLRHHRAAHLTDPLEDPESTYMSPQAWADAGPARRTLHRASNTLLGRVLIGPACTIGRFWLGQVRWLRSPAAQRIWLGHAAAVCVLLVWVCLVCHVSLLAYAAFCVYPGTALIMIRSLAEHRAAERPEDRTAVVERGGLLGLLFLNNNLHLLHHEHPSIPWFALPARWRASRQEMLTNGNGPVYRSYVEVARRFATRPQHGGPHPVHAASLS